MYTITGWLVALAIRVVRLTSVQKFHDDPRPGLKDKGDSYIYAVLLAMQLSTVVVREKKTGAMVSASKDGDLLVPALRLNGVIPFRGSARTRDKDKGGRKALEQMIEHSKKGLPTYFAIDGPRGPRNHVHKGVAELARQSGAAVILTYAVPRRRKILIKTWDRTQIHPPLNRIDVYFSEPIYPGENESTNDLRQRITQVLTLDEKKFDPEEAIVR